jgi:hypothetical protein
MLAGSVLISPLPSGSPVPGLESTPARSIPRPGAVAPLPRLRRWWPAAAALVGGSVLIDGVGRLVHLPLLSAGVGAAGLLLLTTLRRKPPAPGSTPVDVDGWLQRLETLLERFESLESITPAAGSAESSAAARRRRLEVLRSQVLADGLQLAVVGAVPSDTAWRDSLVDALRVETALTLHWSRPLPAATGSWTWPEPFAGSDLLLYCLRPPLMASDLRWLQALPAGQSLWILLQIPPQADAAAVEREIRSQIPVEQPFQLLLLQEGATPAAALEPLAAHLAREGTRLKRRSRERCLAAQHRFWQAELETLRRAHLRVLQQRTQWAVAAAVVAAPLPSLDLLVLAVANGLMVKEMARLWDCPWSAGQLRATAVELARAALALGVVEWTGQTLAALVKWHGATWLLGSTVQALSAAYLTRVVSRAMADTLALSAGVAEADLERIRREAPLLVARAAEAERLDWQAFLQQGRRWLADRAVGSAAQSVFTP